MTTDNLDKTSIGSLFDRIASSYDSLNHLFSLDIDRLWRRRAISEMQPHTDVLDVAIGTADLALQLIRRGKAIHVQGIDLSEQMMAIGKEKVKRKLEQWKKKDEHKDAQICFQRANAQQMPFEDEQFEAVTCGFGVRNFSDLDAGLREMYRVMKKGGELMILEFSYPVNPLVRFFYDAYFTYVIPFAGRLLSKDKTAYTYLNHSVKSFPFGEDFVEHLSKAGFQQTRYKPLTFGIATIYYAIK
jgi:demethylmenaquinone methyltransferase/2-methoxy-6-polyprenyl-1,4-benzoquinol methylase